MFPSQSSLNALWCCFLALISGLNSHIQALGQAKVLAAVVPTVTTQACAPGAVQTADPVPCSLHSSGENALRLGVPLLPLHFFAAPISW